MRRVSPYTDCTPPSRTACTDTPFHRAPELMPLKILGGTDAARSCPEARFLSAKSVPEKLGHARRGAPHARSGSSMRAEECRAVGNHALISAAPSIGISPHPPGAPGTLTASPPPPPAVGAPAPVRTPTASDGDGRRNGGATFHDSPKIQERRDSSRSRTAGFL
jgi:hypothetical protein